jgi:hypothetical protein
LVAGFVDSPGMNSLDAKLLQKGDAQNTTRSTFRAPVP